jgi:hypothetical protein
LIENNLFFEVDWLILWFLVFLMRADQNLLNHLRQVFKDYKIGWIARIGFSEWKKEN